MTMIVVIVPGPTTTGKAMGKKETSEAGSWACSSCSLRSRREPSWAANPAPESMDRPMVSSTSPPATRKWSTLTPKKRRTDVPVARKTAQMTAEYPAILRAVRRWLATLRPVVRDRNRGRCAKGFMIAKRAPKALIRRAVSTSTHYRACQPGPTGWPRATFLGARAAPPAQRRQAPRVPSGTTTAPGGAGRPPVRPSQTHPGKSVVRPAAIMDTAMDSRIMPMSRVMIVRRVRDMW